AISLRSISVPAYNFLRKHLPLPAPSAVRRWDVLVRSENGSENDAGDLKNSEPSTDSHIQHSSSLPIIYQLIPGDSVKVEGDSEPTYVIESDEGDDEVVPDCEAYYSDVEEEPNNLVRLQ